jgi:hypothetical protein
MAAYGDKESLSLTYDLTVQSLIVPGIGDCCILFFVFH